MTVKVLIPSGTTNYLIKALKEYEVPFRFSADQGYLDIDLDGEIAISEIVLAAFNAGISYQAKETDRTLQKYRLNLLNNKK